MIGVYSNLVRNLVSVSFALAVVVATPAAGQLVSPLGGVVGDVVGNAGRALEPLKKGVDGIVGSAAILAEQRVRRLDRLVRKHRDLIELDVMGEPARRGELLVTGAADADLGAAHQAGFVVLGRENLDELGLSIVRVGAPAGTSLAHAERLLKQLSPNAEVSADHLHFVSGSQTNKVSRVAPPSSDRQPTTVPVGIIDGAPGPLIKVDATRGFARGAPIPSNHGTAVASLLGDAGVRHIFVADVYGSDPAGGNALAIARGLNWLVAEGAQVVSISLVGPDNPILKQAIAAARKKGRIIVAAVGNDGPASPPSYPASYPGVIAVSAVDGRNRALIEAGRAIHLDYTAPGADMLAQTRDGKYRKVRGTSYAAPLVAARAAAAIASAASAPAIELLDGEALDLGVKGPDQLYGRGLVCGWCRRTR